MGNIEKNAFSFRKFLSKIGLFSRELSTAHSENTEIDRLSFFIEFSAWFHIFVIDIHQNMPISLTLTPFDHFQNMSSGGIGPDLTLTMCHNLPYLHEMHVVQQFNMVFNTINTIKLVENIP